MTDGQIWEKAVHVWKVGAHELERLQHYIDRDAFGRVVKSIAECRGRILTAGVGTSSAAAR